MKDICCISYFYAAIDILLLKNIFIYFRIIISYFKQCELIKNNVVFIILRCNWLSDKIMKLIAYQIQYGL